MSPRPDVSEERKNQILEAAQRLFSKLGFYQARMSDIAEESGLSKGTLYWYFKSKNDIILGLLDHIFESELKDLQSLVEQESPFAVKIEVYIDRIIDDMEHMVKWMPLAYDFISLAFRQETVQKAIRKYYQAHMDILIPIIEQGIEDGQLTVNAPEEAAIAIGALIEGTGVLWVYDPELIDVRTHLRSNLHLLLKGLLDSS